MIILVVGGSKSKKSDIGELLAEHLHNEGNLYYLATMKASDNDDKARIENHIKSRDGHGYITIEQYRDIDKVSNKVYYIDTLLLDSITSLVTNEMFIGSNFNEEISNKIISDIKNLSNNIKNIVIVSDFVFSDGIVYDKYTEIFRREIGKVNCLIAELADIVIESSFGNVTIHKGKERIENEELISWS